MDKQGNILVATDLHNDCIPVVKQAADIAQQRNATLSIITVVPSVPYYMASGLSSVSDIESELETESRRRLDSIKEKIDFEADYYLKHGTAKLEIIKLSKALDASLIVIGSHGHRGVQRLLGSTASGVLHRAACDVLVVRIKD